MTPALKQVKSLLDRKYLQYDHEEFITGDPVSVPHRFYRKEDIEISGFLTATISWGQRATIVRNARNLMELMDDSPFEYIFNASRKDLISLRDFKHRTFNGEDLAFFILSLQQIYRNHGGLETAFSSGKPGSIKEAIIRFRQLFLSYPHPGRSGKHVSNPMAGSSAKRLNMFLRWMVRADRNGVDFGIWKSLRQQDLMCPLDLHSGNVARKLGLIQRKQNDWKALEELMAHLRAFDPSDPVKYDYALFGLGIFEKY